MTPKVIITIEGGIFQHASSNTENIEIVVVDYDKHAEDRVIIYGPVSPDNVFEDGKAHELLTDEKYPLSEEEVLVKEHLIEHNF